MKICFFSIATHLGGAEKSLLDLVSGLENISGGRYSPWLLFPKSRGPLLELLRMKGVPYESVDMPKGLLETSRSRPSHSAVSTVFALPQIPGYLSKARKILKREKTVLIHSTGIKCHLFAPLVRPKGLPVLWHFRDILSSPMSMVFRFASNVPKVHIIANSMATASALDKGNGKPLVVYNGLDAKTYKSEKNKKIHRQLGLDENTPLVGILGVIARWKGHFEFIHMASRLIKDGSDAHFIIIGDEIYDTLGETGVLEQLQAEVQKLGLAGRVHFTGFARDASVVLNGLDILVHTSIRPEPFGRVVLEAMAVGVPVVASAAGGVLEFVTDNETGLLFPPGDEGMMAVKVQMLLNHPEVGRRLVENAHRNFLEKFTIESHIRKVVEVYDQILGVSS